MRIVKTMIIKSNGDIKPKDAPIKRDGNIYFLISDLKIESGDGIIIERDNVIINGNGHILQGPEDYYGIKVKDRNGVEIKNIMISGFLTGIFLSNSSHNAIIENTLNGNEEGIALLDSSNNMIINNRLISCGLTLFNSYNNTVKDNIVNDKPLVYLEGKSDKVIRKDDIGQAILVKCRNMIVEDLKISNATAGIELLKTYKSIIVNNELSKNNRAGILILDSSRNIITENVIKDNWSGVSLSFSSCNTITKNIVKHNKIGIYLLDSSGNRIYYNSFVNNEEQVCMSGALNVWSYKSKGNYWSDYRENDSNGDGIGDAPYIIDDKNNDNYPLMKPHSFYEVNRMFQYFEKLENLRRKDKISKKIYLKLKDEYKRKLRELKTKNWKE